MRWKIVVIPIVILIFSCSPNREPLPSLDPDLKAKLTQHIVEHYRTPEEYVIGKFADHDIVFLGEYHRIKHDVELVHNLIPLLYKNGIYNLGIEFADYLDQDAIDHLIALDTYDDSLACQIQFNQDPFWGFEEYIDIFRIAWCLNHRLPKDARKFRVIGLNAKSDWSYVKTEEDRKNPEIMKKVWKYGYSDEVMAEVIMKEFVDKGEKALIYSGRNHAYTEYRQPVYDESEGKFVRFVEDRMGNRVYDQIGKRCITIFLHQPWPSSEGYGKPYVYPADGIIDALMAQMEPRYRRVGFDIKGTPFEKLPGKTSLWKYGYDEFTLGMYCDGYIYQKPLSKYKGVTVVPEFINENNRLDAIAQSANPQAKDTSRSVEDVMADMARDTDFAWRFRRFH